MGDDFLIEENLFGIIDIPEFLVTCLPDAVKEGSGQAIDGEDFLALVAKVDHNKHRSSFSSFKSIISFKTLRFNNLGQRDHSRAQYQITLLYDLINILIGSDQIPIFITKFFNGSLIIQILMLNQSSITFETQRSIPSVFLLQRTQSQPLFSDIEKTLNDIEPTSEEQTALLERLARLLERTKETIREKRDEQIQEKKKCLEHIEILLYQRDYEEALRKIDYYKNNPEAKAETSVSISQFDPSEDTSPLETYRDLDLSFDEARRIIENRYYSFEKKHEVWLHFMMAEDEEDQKDLQHVTFEDIQKAEIAQFKEEFSIKDESDSQQFKENAHSQANLHPKTPEKKSNSKSMICLKSGPGKSNKDKKHERSSGKQERVNNSQNGKQKSIHTKSPGVQKSYDCYASAEEKRNKEKKTVRKIGTKENQQSKTNKKVTPFVF